MLEVLKMKEPWVSEVSDESKDSIWTIYYVKYSESLLVLFCDISSQEYVILVSWSQRIIRGQKR